MYEVCKWCLSKVNKYLGFVSRSDYREEKLNAGPAGDIKWLQNE
jgi:hypothetical protein